jgi:type II secretory pathway pseudopilin PulG
MALITSNRGFTYIAALMAVVIMGIMLGAGGQSWKTAMQREKEKELLFRGIEIRNALVRWHYPQGRGGSPRTRLNDLKDLLKDPRTPGTSKYLRRLYKDPITGKDWETLRDPMWGVVGVFSASEAAPLKKGNFPKELKEFEGKTKYSDWQFAVQKLPTVPASSGGTTVPGAATTGRYSEGP